MRFRQLSRAYGAPGSSWWDWQETSSRDWGALAQPIGNLSGFKAGPTMPRLSTQSRGGLSSGDLVVWAQEHLVSAGARIRIDGSFGSQTQTAVTRFQTSHGLSPTGVLDASDVAGAAPLHARQRDLDVEGRATRAEPPRAVRCGSRPRAPPAFRARRYEIPPHLGAGAGPR